MPAPRIGRIRPIVVLGLLASLVAAGCGRRGHEAPQGGAVVPLSKTRVKRNVELVQVKQEKMSSFVDTVGYLDAEGQTNIAAGVPGVVSEVLFREGDWVVKGQTLLVRIDPPRYRALLAQAQANVEKAKASVTRMMAVIKKSDAAARDAEQSLDLR